jgi:hypothetical protein
MQFCSVEYTFEDTNIASFIKRKFKMLHSSEFTTMIVRNSSLCEAKQAPTTIRSRHTQFINP